MTQSHTSRRAFVHGAATALLAADFATATRAGEPTKAAAVPQTYLADFRAAAQIKWPKNRSLKVVCHGHSVPAGYFKTPVVRTFDAYPHLLHVALAEKYPFAVTNVTVTAIGGEASAAGAARFERDVLALRPDVVTIDYGLNDRRLGLPAARQAWTAMIAAARTAGVKVLLLTPTPDLAAKLGDAADPLNQHATQIKALAAEQRVGLVDSLAAFTTAVAGGTALSNLMSQGNHPNRAGHERVARKLIDYF